jgi:hypothetical protein
MLRAEVKRWVSLDLPDSIARRDDPEDCCVMMQADIGPVGEDSADTFSFEVCSVPRASGPVYSSSMLDALRPGRETHRSKPPRLIRPAR